MVARVRRSVKPWVLRGLIRARAPRLVATATRQLAAVDAAVDAAVETLAPASELLQISSANS
jgi:hypothetical protein